MSEDLSETSLAAAASARFEIEASVPLKRFPALDLGLGFDDDGIRGSFLHKLRSTGRSAYLLRDALFHGKSKAFFVGGRKIADTCYMTPRDLFDKAEITDPVSLDPRADYVMARALPNYYHWLIQAVPAVDWSLRTLNLRNPVLLTGALSQRQRETLDVLGYGDVPRLEFDFRRSYLFPKIYYTEFQSGILEIEVCPEANKTYAAMIGAALDASPAEADILYIARFDSKRRPIVDEDKVAQRLEAEGVRVVVPGELPVTRQINLFHKASAVIGGHGAGLSNIAFSRPGTVLYEILPSFFYNQCFAQLAQSRHVDYMADIFPNLPGDDGDVFAQAWRIDLDVVLRRLDTIRDRIGSRLYRPPPVQSPAPFIAGVFGSWPR